MTSDKPQPGDVWERDGERREVVYEMFGMWYIERGKRTWCGSVEWREWQSGATLVERKEPTK